MAHILKNENLEIHMDSPFENYKASRFDWTGKIGEVKFQGVPLTGFERPDHDRDNHFGRGFYNEFGIDTALGFAETRPGGWFHKIGVGLLKKEGDAPYLFSNNYRIDPAEFDFKVKPDRFVICCSSKNVNGYAYELRKTLVLEESGFTLHYHLENRGEKDIETTEYVHNFIAVDRDLIGRNYKLRFPFQIKPGLFEETVNPEGKVVLGKNEITFSGSPNEPFFFSNLSGNEKVGAQWKLTHLAHKIGLMERGSFKAYKANLWGWKHVISPELFFKIFLEPGKAAAWSRTYSVDRID